MTKNVSIPANIMKAYEISMKQIAESNATDEEKRYAYETIMKLAHMQMASC